MTASYRFPTHTLASCRALKSFPADGRIIASCQTRTAGIIPTPPLVASGVCQTNESDISGHGRATQASLLRYPAVRCESHWELSRRDPELGNPARDLRQPLLHRESARAYAANRTGYVAREYHHDGKHAAGRR